MSDDWKARLADLLKKIQQERQKAAAGRNVATTLVKAIDPSGRLRGGVNYTGEDE
jgi:hypothetical protein